jgi:hypothetical protein
MQLGYRKSYADRNVRGRYRAALRALEASVGSHGLARRVAQALDALAQGGRIENAEARARDSA